MDWNKYLTYNSETGILIWKKRDLSEFKTVCAGQTWNTKYAGAVAGTQRGRRNGAPGSIGVAFKGKIYGAHRIIWVMVNKHIPDGLCIDHINGDPYDNRLSNLRLATHSQNMCNRGPQTNNKSGIKGVTFDKRTGRWQAQIMARKKYVFLGRYDTTQQAQLAYADAAVRLHGEYA